MHPSKENFWIVLSIAVSNQTPLTCRSSSSDSTLKYLLTYQQRYLNDNRVRSLEVAFVIFRSARSSLTFVCGVDICLGSSQNEVIYCIYAGGTDHPKMTRLGPLTAQALVCMFRMMIEIC